MWKLTRYIKGYWKEAIIAPICKLIEALFELIIPLVVAQIIDVGIPNADKSYIWTMGGIMVGLAILGLLITLLGQYFAAKASNGFGTNLRNDLYRHINTFSFTELDIFGSASLITRINNDSNQAQQAVSMFIRLVLRAPFIVVGSVVMAFIINWKLALIFVATSIAIALALYLIMSRTFPYYRRLQNKLDKVSKLTRENLEGNRVVRAFSRQNEEQEQFSQEVRALAKTGERVGVISGLLNPMTFVIVNVAIIAILWFGAGKVDSGVLAKGDIIALVNYLTQIFLALVVMAHIAVLFTKASACGARINEVLDVKTSIEYPDVEPVAVDDKPSLEFDKVNFSYHHQDDTPLIKDVSFCLNTGEVLGIIGATGSGKSTLINLIPRFYDVLDGNIYIDGVNVKDYPQDTLRQLISVVPQRAMLFAGTIRENMQWRNATATDEEIWHALDIAQASAFVKDKQDGLDSKVLQGGKNFSGGQRQRLTLARALISAPKILILDDAASALDYATESKLRTALRRNVKGSAVVIVSQRAASIKHADKIIVLEEGKIVGYGNHKQLLKNCDIYKDICLSQHLVGGEV